MLRTSLRSKHIDEACPLRRLARLALLGFAVLLEACGVPQVEVEVTPGGVALTQGGSATVTLSATIGDGPCLLGPAEVECDDISGRPFDYVVHHLPAGLTYAIDTSLQSPSTPGVVRITFSAAATATTGAHEVLIQAELEETGLGSTPLTLRVLPAGGTVTTAAPAAIATGNMHSLAVLADGTLLAWGDNDRGQLGLGDTRIRSTPTPVTMPVSIRHAAGASCQSGIEKSASAAVGADGALWTWGDNSFGRLGLGDRRARTMPEPVEGLDDVQTVRLGASFALALTGDGTAWGWGANDLGQLGNGSTDGALTPVQIQSLGGGAVADVAAGCAHALALISDGTVRAWGANQAGQLGNGTRSGEGEPQAEPIPVPDLLNVQSIAAGRHFSLALDGDGSVWAWGANDRGQLGQGSSGSAVPSVTLVDGLPEIRDIAAGRDYALAAAVDGTLWAWGENAFGQLGVGDETDRDTPVQVPELTGVLAVAAGGEHALAVLDCGQVWAWGRNTFGQLGDGTRRSRNAPIPLTALVHMDDSTCDRVALRVNIIGGGGSVTDEDGALECGAVVDDAGEGPAIVECLGVFDRGATVSLTAEAEEGADFEGWALDCSGAGPQISVPLTRSTQCSATFGSLEPELFLLSVEKTGAGDGSVTSSAGGHELGPESIDCGDTCDAIFAVDSVVTLTAAPAEGFVFDGWSGDCSGGDTQTTVTMDGRKICDASFGSGDDPPPLPPPPTGATLSVGIVETSGTGTVTSDPPGIDCSAVSTDCDATFPVGEVVTLTATPDADSVFVGWNGHPDCVDGTVTLDTGKSCFAVFDTNGFAEWVTLRFTVTGAGNVTTADEAVFCGADGDDCSEIYPFNYFTPLGPTSVLVSAAPGSRFIGWGGDCASAGTTTPFVLSSLDPDFNIGPGEPLFVECTAQFTEAGETPEFFSVVIVFDGPGLGEVNISPPNVTVFPGNPNFCDGARCAVGELTGTVTLTAREVGSGTFQGWDPADCDAVNGNECTIELEANVEVSATFE